MPVHPRALGEGYHVTWASAWPAIGQPFEKALGGKTSFLENQRMFLERNGYQEETFFTFSLSPIRDQDGQVEGVFHPVTETTAKLLSERRTRAIRDIAARAGKGTEFQETCELAMRVLAEHELDIPFSLLYGLEGAPGTASLLSCSGVAPGHALAPRELSLAGGEGSWPLQEVIDSAKTLELVGLRSRFGDFRAGPYPEPPATCFLLPIHAGSAERPIAVLIAGASSRLPLDESYKTFFEMVGASVAGCINTARAYEHEKKRAEALAELDRAKTTFFSNISHEFRTPLTLMLGPLEELLAGKRGQLPTDVASDLEVVNRNAARLLKLVNALLDFSRFEANRVRARFEPTDLTVLTAELASAFASMIEKAELAFNVDLEQLARPVFVDRDMWEKIVLNLLSNAFKFTFAGEIRISLRARADRVELSVRDTGTGIPESELGKVFQRFHRIQGAQGRTHEGTGIGLALVQELVKLHGGKARVESRQGQGSSFFIEIPFGSAHLPQDQVLHSEGGAARSSQQALELSSEAAQWLSQPKRDRDPSPSASATGPASSLPQAQKNRVLVADDNADMRNYVVRLLEDRYQVEAVDSGKKALESIRARMPDLLLSDIMMPGMNGFELLQEVRADRSLRRLPVILLSARAGEEAKVEGLEAGADDYLIKPFAARELVARVQTHLGLAAVRQELDRERESLKMRDEFLSIASHELRTPLTPLKLQIQNLTRLLRNRSLSQMEPERLQKVAVICESQIQRLSGLVDDLLDVSRMRTGQLELKRIDTDLSQVVHDTCERYRPLLKKSGCTLSEDVAPGVRASVDPMRFEQVLGNLIGNAIRHAFSCPLSVELRQQDGWTVLSVRDRGRGISKQRQQKLFRRFETAGAGYETGGLGLGLYISREIVSAHGGTLEVESESGEGAVFWVRLPAASAGAAPLEQEREAS